MQFASVVIFAVAIFAAAKGCEDILDICPNLVTSCKDSNFVRGACEKTCGFCSGRSKQGGCADNFSLCAELKSSCKSEFVKRNCPKTCSTCVSFSTPSPCSKTCGAGTSVSSTANGTKEYKPCNIQPCSLDICPNGERRREIPNACCTADPVKTCGVPSTGIKHPWLAAVKIKELVCSGAIISTRWVITAVECLREGDKTDSSDVEIYVGIEKGSELSWAADTILFPKSRLREVEEVVFHPALDFPKADIVLVKLKQDLVFNEAIQPVCLPGGEITPTDTKCFISGWDVTDSTFSRITYVPREAVVSNFDLDVCRTKYVATNTANFLKKEESWLCAGNLYDAKDSCVGFSGAPLVCQRCSSCSYYVAGILSFGSYPCQDLLIPLISTKVLHYEMWIKKVTGIFAERKSCSYTVGP